LFQVGVDIDLMDEADGISAGGNSRCFSLRGLFVILEVLSFKASAHSVTKAL